jgi:hypothetical protein
MTFGDGFCLRVFADHTESDPSFNGNWEAVINNTRVSVGPGTKISITPDANKLK